MVQSQDSTNYDSSKMHVYSRHTSERREVFNPNKDVTQLLVNPEQALKKNLKPIKTAYGKDRAPLRSLFSTRAGKTAGMTPIESSFIKEVGRYKRRQSPN